MSEFWQISRIYLFGKIGTRKIKNCLLVRINDRLNNSFRYFKKNKYGILATLTFLSLKHTILCFI